MTGIDAEGGTGDEIGSGTGSGTGSEARARTELEAAAFRRLVAHLRAHPEVQNIDLMNLAGFCRNCLSNWLKDAADANGVAMTKDESRERVYGMPYEAWKARHQAEATPAQTTAFADAAGRAHGGDGGGSRSR